MPALGTSPAEVAGGIVAAVVLLGAAAIAVRRLILAAIDLIARWRQ
jgi:hypothetical protein